MADEKAPKDKAPADKSESRAKTASRSRAQAEFDRYKARVASTTRAAAPGFAGPPAFSIGAGAVPGWGGGAGSGAVGYPGYPGFSGMSGSPFGGDPPYAGLGLPYGPISMPPPVPPDSLTERLRYTLRLGVDVVNATLSGGLRVLGGVSDAASWAGDRYGSRRGCGGHGQCGSGCGNSSCGCHDCCTSCDPCCHSGVSSCGCDHCC